MNKLIILVCLLLGALFSTGQRESTGFLFMNKKDSNQIDLLWKGALLTSYCYYDSIRKPFLFPVNTLDGITVTRGYPIKPIPGERVDHPHHTGMWLNYESVNGLDFWNNSTAIPVEKRSEYGTIFHVEVLDEQVIGNKASLVVTAKWVKPDGNILLHEKTKYIFTVAHNLLLLDRVTTLTAANETVVFKDSKDGFFAMRVARELEMPSKDSVSFVDIHGNRTIVPRIDNYGVTGMYYSSNGLKGDSVWSSKGAWTMLIGKKEGKDITIGILDHPSNTGFPSYWHARGYGLFAINPLGRKIFSNGKEELNYSLKPGASTTFHYRVVIASRRLSGNEMNQLSIDFGKEK